MATTPGKAWTRILLVFLCIVSMSCLIATLAAVNSICSLGSMSVGVFRAEYDGHTKSMIDVFDGIDDMQNIFRVVQGSGICAVCFVFFSMCALILFNNGKVGRAFVMTIMSIAVALITVFWIAMLIGYTYNYGTADAIEKMSAAMNLTYGLFVSILAMLLMLADIIIFAVAEKRMFTMQNDPAGVADGGFVAVPLMH